MAKKKSSTKVASTPAAQAQGAPAIDIGIDAAENVGRGLLPRRADAGIGVDQQGNLVGHGRIGVAAAR